MIESGWSFALLLTVCLFPASRTIAQPAGIAAQMLFPPRNYEIALGDSITPSVRVWNRDTISHDSETIRYIIRNVVTRIAVYSHFITLPTIAPGDSLDTTFAPYPTNANILSQLGTFDACLIVNSDTVCTRLFDMRRTPLQFRDHFDNYAKTASGDIPDQTLWASVGATVVDGEDSTWDPPPPRYSPPGVGPDTMLSPVIRLDRKDMSGNFYSGDGVGDTLTSFPINMQGKTRMTFSFDFMRAGRHHYPLRWDSAEMVGPESTILDSAGKVFRPGDSLILEFKKPSAPAVNPGPSDWNEMAAIDGGRDFEFKTFFARPVDSGLQITIDGKTSFLADTPNYFTNNFRFRFRLKAKDDGTQTALPKDDADAWYIDNPEVSMPLLPEIQVQWVRVVNPYSKVPRSQTIFPVYAKVMNFESGGQAIPIQVVIVNPSGDTVYSQLAKIAFLDEGEYTILSFPPWDASREPGNGAAYTAIVSMVDPLYDDGEYNGDTYTKFYLNIDDSTGGVQEFAYDDAGLDPGPDAGNDIPNLTHLRYQGIGFNGSTSGSFAMKFQLVRPDTFYGVRVNFALGYEPDDYVRVSLLNGDSNSCTPLDTVIQAGIQSTVLARGGDDFQLSRYYFPTPIPLQPGTYWISISELGLTDFMLGGNIFRSGGEIVRASKTAPKINSIYGPSTKGTPCYGTQWGPGPGDNNGNVSCSFAVEWPAGSGNWKPMMPDSGLWPTMDSSNALSWHFIPDFDAPWTGAGTYFPLMRAIFAGNPPSGVKTSPAIPNFGLGSDYPNPFDPTSTSTTISFTLPTQAPVSLTICNIMGDVVKTIVNAAMPAGTHSVSWDGRDEHGAVVPAGIYFVALKSAESHATTKLIVTE